MPVRNNPEGRPDTKKGRPCQTHPPTRTGILRIDPESQLEALVLDPDAFQSPLPVQHYALIFEDEDIGLAVGIWDTTTMQEAFGPYPGDEYITVLDGGFAMVDAAGQELAAARRAIASPSATAFPAAGNRMAICARST